MYNKPEIKYKYNYICLTFCTLFRPMGPNIKTYVTEDFLIWIFEMSLTF